AGYDVSRKTFAVKDRIGYMAQRFGLYVDLSVEENMSFYADLFGLGNILVFLVGGGDITIQKLQAEESSVADKLSSEDMNIIFNNRVANIQKIYPYVPDSLNYILLHFSQGANMYYEGTRQLLEDLGEVQINA
ncbi:MAG: hypothetical protein ACWGN1_04305, partial [Desulfobulbales bacterium]